MFNHSLTFQGMNISEEDITHAPKGKAVKPLTP